MISSLLYVSQSNLQPPTEQAEIERIVKVARLRNEQLQVTGMLLCAAGRFAQILEGPAMSVSILMRSIEADTRHRDVRVIATETLAERRFPDWTLGYSGPSLLVDRHIKPLLQQQISETRMRALAGRLTELMIEIAESEQLETGGGFSW